MGPGGVQAPPPGGRTPARAGAEQRYYNKGTGRMEAGHGQFSTEHHAVPSGHQVSKTSTTVTRERAPGHAPGPAPAVGFDLLHATSQQIEAHAQELVNKDIESGRVPFQQKLGQLGNQQSTAEAKYGQLGKESDTGLQQLQATQAQQGAGFAARADEIAKQSSNAAQLGVNAAAAQSGGYVAGQVARQGEAAAQLLGGIAARGQQQTQTRQQDEASYLTNLRAIVGQKVAEGQKNIANVIGKEKLGVSNRENELTAKGPAESLKLTSQLEGEQGKLRLADRAEKLREAELGRKFVETKSQVKNREQTQATNKYKAETTAEYHNKSLAEKTKTDAARISQGAERIAIARQKAEASGKKGSKTPKELGALDKEAGTVFNAFDRMKQEGKSNAEIRNAIIKGGYEVKEKQYGTHFVKGKPERYEKPEKWVKINQAKANNPYVINAIEQLWVYHTINPQTRAAVEGAGYPLPDDKSLYEALSGRAYSPPPVSGSANAGGRSGGGVSG